MFYSHFNWFPRMIIKWYLYHRSWLKNSRNEKRPELLRHQSRGRSSRIISVKQRGPLMSLWWTKGLTKFIIKNTFSSRRRLTKYFEAFHWNFDAPLIYKWFPSTQKEAKIPFKAPFFRERWGMFELLFKSRFASHQFLSLNLYHLKIRSKFLKCLNIDLKFDIVWQIWYQYF